jgi:hypothetical protein
VVGVPTIVVVGPDVGDNESPVPARAGADQRMVRFDAAVAENWIGAG